MNIVIVAKTRMTANLCCVGALALDGARNVRLLRRDSANQPADAPFNVGEIWDVDARPRLNVTPPHVEDVLVHYARRIGEQEDLRQFILSRCRPWQGPPSEIFDGLLRFTEQGAGCIERNGRLPAASVGFWIPSCDLCYTRRDGKVRYECAGQGQAVCLPYVGYAEPTAHLPRGALLRVSLCRWWRPAEKPEEPERCYLQLSGWYGVLPGDE